MIRLRSGRIVTAIMRNTVQAVLRYFCLLTESGISLKTEDGEVIIP